MITLALTLLALPQVELNAQQTKLINAIIQVESSGKDDAVGDNGKAIGCLQIWKPYWLDATERSNIGGKHTDCFKRDYAVRIFDAYMNRYAGSAWQSQSAFNPEFVARIHNGGPKGYKKTATVKYWKKVKILLDRKGAPCYTIRMNKPDLNKPVFQLVPDLVQRIDNKQCVTCPNDILDMDFRDEISIKEYGISGMCQECQDSVFGNNADE